MAKRAKRKRPPPKSKVKEQDVKTVLSVGGGTWTEAQVRAALTQANGNVQDATENLMLSQIADVDVAPAPPPPKKRKLNHEEEKKEATPPAPPSPPKPPAFETAFSKSKAKYQQEKTELEARLSHIKLLLTETNEINALFCQTRSDAKFPNEEPAAAVSSKEDPAAAAVGSNEEPAAAVGSNEKSAAAAVEGFKWLREQFESIRHALAKQRGVHKEKLKLITGELRAKEEAFHAKREEYESQKLIAEMIAEDAKQGVRMSADDRNIYILQLKGKPIEKEYSCSICFCEYPLNEFAFLDCCHGTCRNCMKQLICAKVREGINGIAILKCPHVPTDEEKEPCDHKLTHEEVRLFIKDDELFAKYEKLQLHQTLNQAEDCRWCPHPGCETAMFGDPDSPMMTCPQCKMKFCFNCKTTEWHNGSSCAQFQQWKKDNDQADAKFETWKKQNTAPCPKCKSSIEKNGGCMHMTCSSCRYEFHWVTREKWKGYEAKYAVSWRANNKNQRPPANAYS